VAATAIVVAACVAAGGIVLVDVVRVATMWLSA
jgi:hypothetical protein